MKTILFQGDSITDAWRSKGEDLYLGSGYPTFVSGELMLDYPEQYKTYNRGVAGHRIVDLYARIKVDFINLKPDILSVLIGVNDVWHEVAEQNGVDAEKFYKVYSMIIEEVKEALPDIKIMIMEPFVLKGSATEANWEIFHDEVLKRAEKSRQIAEKYHLSFISLQDKFDEVAKLAPNSYWLYDGVHPTVAGYELIKREWMKAFKKL